MEAKDNVRDLKLLFIFCPDLFCFIAPIAILSDLIYVSFHI